MAEMMLTTIDNPYDPFTQFDEWYAFDEAMGYRTTEYLDRVTLTSEEFSDSDQMAAIDEAIEEICEYNVTGKYKKVYGSFD